MKIYLNGKILESKDAAISVFDRGYLFGEGLFETFRSYDGKVPFITKHLDRMEWSSTFIGIPFPHPEEIKKAVQEVLQANQLADARIKVVLTAQGDSFKPAAPTDDMNVNLLVSAEILAELPQAYYKKGVGIIFVHSVMGEVSPITHIKSTSWGSKMVARREVEEKGAFEGVFINPKGFVTEGTVTNLFWVKEGTLFTVPQNEGLLGGVTRGLVLELAKKNHIPFKELPTTPADLKKSDEIFLTNSLYEILPVTLIEEEEAGKGKVGPLTLQLIELYKACRDEYI